MPKINYFETCKCPSCKHALDTVVTTEKNCPYCNAKLDTRAVWLTKKDNNISLPRWLERSIIPLLVLLGGVFFTFYTVFFLQIYYYKISAVLIGGSLAYLIYNNLGNDESY